MTPINIIVIIIIHYEILFRPKEGEHFLFFLQFRTGSSTRLRTSEGFCFFLIV